MFWFKVLIVASLGVAFCQAQDNSTVTVNTTTGLVLGSYGERTTSEGKKLYIFRSIPFGEPPVGDLRFEPPVPKKAWNGTLDVRKAQPICIQESNPPVGAEDCLYLKLYTDEKPDPRNKLPVMVYIYGGGFYLGYAHFDEHNRPDYLIEQDVIVIGIQYRVGILGFMSLEDEVAPGNNGIRDQILALKWIKENVINFGGDPDKITIFGQSAGAASIAYLLQIEETKGLFSKAILQSGSSLGPWAIGKNIPNVTKAIADDLNVDLSNSTTIKSGLKNVDAITLQDTSNSNMISEIIMTNPIQGLVYGPVIEPNHKNAVITGKSHENLRKGLFHHVPILTGYNSLEGYFDDVSPLVRLWFARYETNYASLVPDDMNVRTPLKIVIGTSIKDKYFGSDPILKSSIRIMRFIGDTQFEKPIVEAIRLYSQKTPVYAYHFSYEGPLWGRFNRSVSGVGHSEELGYLFDFGYNGTDADYLTRSRMVKLWTNFVKTGNPTPESDPLLENITWPVNTGSQDLKYLDINKNFSVVSLPNNDKIHFWNELYELDGNPPFGTY